MRKGSVLLMSLLFVTASCLLAEEKKSEHKKHSNHQKEKSDRKEQKHCPVMGGKVNKQLYVDHDGKRIYVCCKGCIPKVKKNPQKYIDKLEKKGVTLTKYQQKCPVMGGKINKQLYVDHDGKRIYVCCKGCIPKVKKSPQKYIDKLEAAGVAPDSSAETGKTGDHDNHKSGKKHH
mgnify:CR=1 FL=1